MSVLPPVLRRVRGGNFDTTIPFCIICYDKTQNQKDIAASFTNLQEIVWLPTKSDR